MTDRNTSVTPPLTQIARDPFSPELIRRENRLDVRVGFDGFDIANLHSRTGQAKERSTHT